MLNIPFAEDWPTETITREEYIIVTKSFLEFAKNKGWNIVNRAELEKIVYKYE